ncbi:MAG TPA: type 3 dihydrofolate reductase [Plasticicumulans sp.]|nr:type 3 dihydrofolate reductase [Plasticicumulans sp.]HNB89479.1 type 3 dihydrofolate reductase [Plasticicumulans sp.]HND99645.1 type 3 dihydrofolate reductase [Plasticicumulans sp.]HNE00713.1 type 3 dihydrofolate reductase [Plasticicumulans sp.]HNO61926.1 type 3 dihydrofolate reductase [Plasticicumulans sp.]
MLSQIVAIGRNRVIGAGNALPWRLPDDLAHFKRLTLGKPVLMGRKTWESLGRPLPGRDNLVITRNPGYHAAGARVFASLDTALAACSDAPEIMLIGGAELYAQTLPICDRLYLTEIDAAPDGDAFFPALDPADWRETAAEPHPADARHAHAFTWRTLERVRR